MRTRRINTLGSLPQMTPVQMGATGVSWSSVAAETVNQHPLQNVVYQPSPAPAPAPAAPAPAAPAPDPTVPHYTPGQVLVGIDNGGGEPNFSAPIAAPASQNSGAVIAIIAALAFAAFSV